MPPAGFYADDDDHHLHDPGHALLSAFPPSSAAPVDASSHPVAPLHWRRWHPQSHHRPSPARLCQRACGPGKRLRRCSTALGRDLSRCCCFLVCHLGSRSLNGCYPCVDDGVVLDGGLLRSCRRSNKAPCRRRHRRSSIGAFRRRMFGDCTGASQKVLALAFVAGFESCCNWEWERTWKLLLLLALARRRDTTLRTLSLRHTARAGSALLDHPGRLDCFALDRM